MGSKDNAIWKNIVAGGIAGCAEITIMYPTDVAKTRAQLSTTPVSMSSTFRSIISEQGVAGLYRGVVTPILAEAPKRAWKFSSNEFFKKTIAASSDGGKLSISGAALSGAMAGVSEALINTPFETVKVRMQAKENLARFKSSGDCFMHLVKEEGILALYKGVEPQMWRNGFWNGIYFGTIGMANIKYPVDPAASKQEKLMHKFCTGVVGSFMGTLANTPFDVVKSRMQQQMAPEANGQFKYRNSLQSIATIANEEGVAALYKGLGPRLVRLGPGGGIMIVAFDTVSGWLEKF